MNATAVPTVKDQKLMPLGLVNSASGNLFSDFISSNSNETNVSVAAKNSDFINLFICHLIFYAIFCVSIVLHIIIDLGLGSFVKNKFLQFLQFSKYSFMEKNTAFA